jgi:hypothetical protein
MCYNFMLLYIFQRFCLFFLITGFNFCHQYVVSYRPLPILRMADGCNLKLVAAVTCWSHGEPSPRPANGCSFFLNCPTYFVLSRGPSLLFFPYKEFTKFPVPFISLLSKCVPQKFESPFVGESTAVPRTAGPRQYAV